MTLTPSVQKWQHLKDLREQSKKPIAKCEHCGGPSKVYAYRLGSYARVLCWLAHKERASERRYRHLPSSGAVNGGGDYAKLRYWGLIESMPNYDGDNWVDPQHAGSKRSSGHWKLTDTGYDFAHGNITVSAVCYYRHPLDGVLGFEPEQIGIHDAIGKRFNYTQLMQGYKGRPGGSTQ
tara:strand:- start:16 stop:549 length:534 start_codon:yes stop_codon:yes gene_type:complete